MEERIMQIVEVCAENGTLGWTTTVGLVAVCLCTIARILHADAVHERECRLRQLELEKSQERGELKSGNRLDDAFRNSE